MRSTINRVDIVGEAKYRFGVRVVVLQSDFNRDFAAIRQFAIALKMDGLVMQHRLTAVQVLDKFRDTTAVEELLGTNILAALVAEHNLETLIEERELTETPCQSIEVE